MSDESTDPTQGEDVPQMHDYHVYHHSQPREPYGNLTMGKNAKGDRTFTIEIKNVTAETFDAAVALRQKLHLEAVAPDPEPEPEVEISGAEVQIELETVGNLVTLAEVIGSSYPDGEASEPEEDGEASEDDKDYWASAKANPVILS